MHEDADLPREVPRVRLEDLLAALGAASPRLCGAALGLAGRGGGAMRAAPNEYQPAQRQGDSMARVCTHAPGKDRRPVSQRSLLLEDLLHEVAVLLRQLPGDAAKPLRVLPLVDQRRIPGADLALHLLQHLRAT